MNWRINEVVILFLIAVLCHYNSVPGEFIYDDFPAILKNPDTTGGRPLSALLSHDFWGYPISSVYSHKSWRPLTVLTYRIQYAIHGAWAAPFRAGNILIHSLSTILFWFVCCRIIRLQTRVAWIATLLFATHPVHTEAINCIVGRAELLSAAFFMISLLAYAHGLHIVHDRFEIVKACYEKSNIKQKEREGKKKMLEKRKPLTVEESIAFVAAAHTIQNDVASTAAEKLLQIAELALEDSVNLRELAEICKKENENSKNSNLAKEFASIKSNNRKLLKTVRKEIAKKDQAAWKCFKTFKKVMIAKRQNDLRVKGTFSASESYFEREEALLTRYNTYKWDSHEAQTLMNAADAAHSSPKQMKKLPIKKEKNEIGKKEDSNGNNGIEYDISSFQFIIHVINPNGPEWMWITSSVIAALFAMTAKEQGVTVLGVCGLYDLFVTVSNDGIFADTKTLLRFLLLQRGRRKDWKHLNAKDIASFHRVLSLFVRGIFMLCSLLSLLSMRWTVMGGRPPSTRVFSNFDNPAAHNDDWQIRLMSIAYLNCLNVWTLFFPKSLCHDWSMGSVENVESLIDLRNLWTFVVLVSIICLFVRLSKSKSTENTVILSERVSLALLLVPYLPSANIFFTVGFVLAERVLYLPSAGFCALLAILLDAIFIEPISLKMEVEKSSKKKIQTGGERPISDAGDLREKRKTKSEYIESVRKKIEIRFIIVSGLILLLYGTRTLFRNADWSSARALYIADAKVNPRNAKMPYGLGRAVLNLNPPNLEEAEEAFLRALQVEPRFGLAAFWLAQTYRKMGPKYNFHMLHAFRIACKESGDLVEAHTELGALLLEWRGQELEDGKTFDMSHLGEAKKRLQRTLELRPGHKRGMRLMAMVQFKQGSRSAAVQTLKELVGGEIYANGSDRKEMNYDQMEGLFVLALIHLELVLESNNSSDDPRFPPLPRGNDALVQARRFLGAAAVAGHSKAEAAIADLQRVGVNLYVKKIANSLKEFRVSYKYEHKLDLKALALVGENTIGPSGHFEEVIVTVKDGKCHVQPQGATKLMPATRDIFREECESRLNARRAAKARKATGERLIHDSRRDGGSSDLPGAIDEDGHAIVESYWLDHQRNVPLKVDDKSFEILVGLHDDVLAVAYISCRIYAPTLPIKQCNGAVAEHLGQQIRVNREKRAQENASGWSFRKNDIVRSHSHDRESRFSKVLCEYLLADKKNSALCEIVMENIDRANEESMIKNLESTRVQVEFVIDGRDVNASTSLLGGYDDISKLVLPFCKERSLSTSDCNALHSHMKGKWHDSFEKSFGRETIYKCKENDNLVSLHDVKTTLKAFQKEEAFEFRFRMDDQEEQVLYLQRMEEPSRAVKEACRKESIGAENCALLEETASYRWKLQVMKHIDKVC
eukprot:g1734.t1